MMLREVKKCVQSHIMSKLGSLNQAARPQNSLINHNNTTYTLKTFLSHHFLIWKLGHSIICAVAVLCLVMFDFLRPYGP